MRKHVMLFALALATIGGLFISCSDSTDDNKNEYANWRSRNDAYFNNVRLLALDSISQAKASYASQWMEHCNWRTYLSYSLSPSATTNTPTDSIYVHILKKGDGSGCPLSTDSVRIFYMGRLIPSTSYSEGYIFDHSGQSTLRERIFDHNTGVPASLLVGSGIRGFATALQYMHIGDIWRIYVPYNLGYKDTKKTRIPAYSTLVFDVELIQYSRKGSMLPIWN